MQLEVQVGLGSKKLSAAGRNQKHLQDIQCDDVQRDMEKHSMGVYVIKKEAEGEDPADVGVILMENLRAPARACAAMLGVIYATNLAYPKELRCYYEFIQKVSTATFWHLIST
ncbi:uncharacterized protein LOC144989396 [Oryzias latipes]